MAKKKPSAKKSAAPPKPPAVTTERFGRLYRLVAFLGEGPKKREQMTAHLGLDVRGFYRDLEVLRAFGIEVGLDQGMYGLRVSAEEAVAMLPYPDPHLSLGEMRQLAKGKSPIHRKMQEQIERLLS